MTTHRGKTIDKAKKFSVIDCASCGFIHLDPIPTKVEIARLYQSKYYSNERPLYIKRNLEDEKWWHTVFKDRLDTLEQYLDKSDRKLIELGSGPGLFLKYAKNKGWDVLGVEPSPIAAKFSTKNGVRVIQSLFEDLELETLGVFDAAVMFEVLEHLENPREILKTVNKLLRKGGVVCISVPNDYNPLQKVVRNALKMKPYWLAPPLHINYFTINSISNLLNKCGFNVVYKETNFPMEMFLLFGDNYVGNDSLGRQMHEKRKKFDIIMSAHDNELKRKLYVALADLEIGRNLTIYGRKK